MEPNEFIDLPKIYKRQAVDLLMFGFVNGVLSALPMVTIKDAIFLFMQKHKITEDHYDYGSARSRYYRMLNESKDIL
jgi:hypothetical protein